MADYSATRSETFIIPLAGSRLRKKKSAIQLQRRGKGQLSVAEWTDRRRMRLRHRQRFLVALVVVVAWTASGADEGDYAEFVREVVNEDQEHFRNDYNNDSSTTMGVDQDLLYEQEMLRQKKDEDEIAEELLRQKQQQREYAEDQERKTEQARNERIQKEREKAFDDQLAKMSDEKRRAAKKQKKRDAVVTRKVLKAAQAGNHYAVLGLLNNRELRIIGEKSIALFPVRLTLNIPEIRLFHTSNKQIKKAYREKAKTVHPDKSTDGRAVEAFLAVENAASILLDEAARAKYDQQVLQRRHARRAKVRGVVGSGLERSLRVASRVFGTAKMFLGPCAFPFFILALLVV